MANELRAIAIHLPQFHPIPENDEWWGKGFTEWTNVAKAKPIFRGHYQPHLPSDLGFYDLRLPEARQAQADLARQYGIHGFCYYHYWFHGKRLIERPVEDMVRTGVPDFPFMLCWANGSWTRTWEGNDNILIEQTYSGTDDINHIRHLITYFKSPNYIKIDNKPVFLVCRTESLPNPAQTAETWRNEVRKEGFDDLYLIRFEMYEGGYSADTIGFDAAADFQPDWEHFPNPKHTLIKRIANKLNINLKSKYRHNIYDYKEIVNIMKNRINPRYKLYPCLTPGWDNSPRKQSGATIFTNSTPQTFEHWSRHTIQNFQPYSNEENFIFINAWNEWAEGNHLEPCQKWGRQFLQAFKNAFVDATL